ncbi:MAG TPA: winged helix-turn-helix transcriptional regulator [Nitrososphaeraceae archaeon]|nr:winged helix-turn-helix transcriptional regulator [Nitrososphaeraceae archaeon]
MSYKLDSIYNNSSEYLTNTLPKLEQELLLCIDENPGIRYRELMRLIKFPNGVLSYHIDKLEKMDLVNVERKSKITRFFPRNISNDIMGILGNLRSQTSYEIIKLLYEKGPISQQEIIKNTRKAASTISWQMKKLLDDNIICIKIKDFNYDENKDLGSNIQGKKTRLYDLLNRNLVNGLFYKTNKYIDSVVTNYSEIVDSF